MYELGAHGDGRLDGVGVHGLGGVGQPHREVPQAVPLNVLI